MPAPGVVGVDFFVGVAALLDVEDEVADGEGVVEGLWDGWVGGWGGVGGYGGRAEGEDGGAGRGQHGDCVGGVGGGHVKGRRG